MTRECSVTVFATDHEEVVFCHDRASGLRAIIAIYSTALGPSLGGTRFYPYETEADALADVLNLSRGMAYKNALAGLDHGGGKAVIWGDPTTDKTEALLRAYGRFVESLGGRYVTACDVGTYVRDMDVVARESRFVTGRPRPRAAPATRRCSPPGASSRACGPAPSTMGHRLAGRPPGRRRRGRQGRPAPGRPPGRRWRRGGRHRRLRRRGRRGDRHAPEVDRPTPTPCPHPARRLRAVRARRRALRRRRRRVSARSSAAPPTTSWPTRGWRRCWPTAASSTRRTTCQLRRCDPGRRRVPRATCTERARTKATAIFDTTREHLRRCRRGGRPTCGCGRSAGGAADGRGRPAARNPGPRPRPLTFRRSRTSPPGGGADAADGPRSFRCPGDLRRAMGAARRPVTRRGTSRPAGCNRGATTMTTLSGPPRAGRPFVLCEGVEPWGAAVPRLSSRRWPVR